MVIFVLYYDLVFDVLIIGYYCDVYGQIVIIVECVVGYYCILGVNIFILIDGSIGNFKNFIYICYISY